MPLQDNPNVGTTGGGLCDPGSGATPWTDTSSGGTPQSSGCVIRRIQDDGTLVACEPNLNFIGTGVTIADDPTNERINITITGGGGGGGSVNVTQDDFTSSLNGILTAFTLSQTPQTNDTVLLYFNGLAQVYGTHFTISGTTLTTLFTPLAGDNLVAVYFY